MTVEDCEEDKELEASRENPAKHSRPSNSEYTWLSVMQSVNIDRKYLILDDCDEHEMYTDVVVQDIGDTVAEEKQYLNHKNPTAHGIQAVYVLLFFNLYFTDTNSFF